MWDKWLEATPDDLGMVALSSVIAYGLIILLVRMAGLRSFSKMSASDFVMTLAVASVFAATISGPTPTLAMGATAIAMLFLIQWLLAFLRRRSGVFGKIVDNEPLLLMAGAEIIEENLTRANVSRADLMGKLREANALNFDQVKAVIFETTGDISVMHTDCDDVPLEPELFTSVVGAERLFPASV